MNHKDNRKLYELAQHISELSASEYKLLCNLFVRKRHALRHGLVK